MTGPPVIWALTDGRAGNEAQALGLAEALARARPAQIVVKRIVPRRWAIALPPALMHGLGAVIPGWPGTGLAAGSDTLDPPWPDLVICAGRRAAPVAAALRRRHGIRAVQILDVKMPARAFDAVIVPEHDRLDASGVLTTVGAMNRLTPAAVAAAAGDWAARLGTLPRPRLAVLVGGPSRSAAFTAGDAGRLTEALAALAATHAPMVTPSRRTDPGLTAQLRARLPESAFVWDGAGANPYPGLLGHADAVLVTEDSVNMASEAATTGLPVHVFPITRVAPKLARFHESLRARGASRIFEGAIEDWSYAPLAEADRIAARLLDRDLL